MLITLVLVEIKGGMSRFRPFVALRPGLSIGTPLGYYTILHYGNTNAFAIGFGIFVPDFPVSTPMPRVWISSLSPARDDCVEGSVSSRSVATSLVKGRAVPM